MAKKKSPEHLERQGLEKRLADIKANIERQDEVILELRSAAEMSGD